MLLSGAPIRIVASPPPFGRFDTDGTCGACCATPTPAAEIAKPTIAIKTRVLMWMPPKSEMLAKRA
jgi:hypothetical protein